VALTVDVGTGHIVVDEVVCAVDAGRAINPDLVAGQIEGGVVQAHGYAITEDLQVRDARILNPRSPPTDAGDPGHPPQGQVGHRRGADPRGRGAPAASPRSR
jgi:hypothetical protein